MVFGGVERIRISSQSLKRAMRRPPKNAYNYWEQALSKPSVRTREINRIIELFSDELEDEFTNGIINRAIQLFVKSKADDNDAEENVENDVETLSKVESKKKIAVAPWILAEIKEICRIVASVQLDGKEIQKAKEKFAKQKAKKKKTEEEFIDQALTTKIKRALTQKKDDLEKAIATAADVALWGRMATSGLMTSIDGSLAIAHAFTTHNAQAEIDWFTAVDDLVQDSEETGAGHLDTQEFSSGVFYRYASLNINQLQKNLGNASRSRALEIAGHVFHMLCTVVPSAKQQSFAAHNPADFSIVSFADQPISMANAFEQPIEKAKAGGFLRPSIIRLVQYWEKSNKFYALDEKAAYCSKEVEITEQKELMQMNSLPELEVWIKTDGNSNK